MSDFFKFREICARYDVTPVTVRRWIAAGKFPAPLRILNRQYFSITDVLAWEARRAV